MNIYESIAKIQSEIDFIGKDKQVKEGGNYRYRGVDQVLNTLHPLFAKHKVFAVPEVLEVLFREEKQTNSGKRVLYEVLRVKYCFYAEDGTNVSAVVDGEAMDSGDKASNKCMSVAYKYACFQILSIPTEETAADPDDEAEEFAPERSSKNARSKDRTSSNAREAFKAQLSVIGIVDTEKTTEYFENVKKKPFERFTNEEVSECIAWANGRVERKRREAENAER